MLALNESRRPLAVALLWFALLAGAALTRPVHSAQTEPAGPQSASPEASGPTAPPAARQPARIQLIRLLMQGGFFMIPILLMSGISITFIIERSLALRRGRVLPAGLVHELGQLASDQQEFDPRAAYRICQKYPSAAANVIRAMLLKVGRPHSEIEHTVTEASQREAERLFARVRWLTLAAAVTPLMGLLGTVWGLIQAFYDTTQLLPGQNKAEQLAKGIYVALVTTLGGLVVAIPSAIFAHTFEGRIQTLFHQIDELMFTLLPQIERFEGRVRFGATPEAAPSRKSEEAPVKR